MDLQSMNRRDPKFQKTLKAGEASKAGGSCMKILITTGVRALRTLESVSGARVTKTKQFGTFMTNCHPIVEELESHFTNPGMLPISFATSVLRGLRRTLEDVTGTIDSAEAGPTVEEECPVQKIAREPGQISYDEVTGLPLDPKLVAGAIKEELMFVRKLRVYHEVPVSFLDKSGLKAIGTRWVYTNKGDAANPFIRARLVAQETKRVSELTP